MVEGRGEELRFWYGRGKEKQSMSNPDGFGGGLKWPTKANENQMNLWRSMLRIAITEAPRSKTIGTRNEDKYHSLFFKPVLFFPFSHIPSQNRPITTMSYSTPIRACRAHAKSRD
jgi:hypothetical protein